MISQHLPKIQYVLNYLPEWCEQDFFFNGDFTVSDKVFNLLTIDEITYIYDFIQNLIKENNGVAYLHCFYSSRIKCALFFSDQLTIKQVESGKYKPEDNYCVIMHQDDL